MVEETRVGVFEQVCEHAPARYAAQPEAGALANGTVARTGRGKPETEARWRLPPGVIHCNIHLQTMTLTTAPSFSISPSRAFTPGRPQRRDTCLRIQPSEKSHASSPTRQPREIAASIARELPSVGSPFNGFVLEDLAPRPLTGLPAEIAGRHGDQPRQHLRRPGAAQRTEVAHGR